MRDDKKKELDRLIRQEKTGSPRLKIALIGAFLVMAAIVALNFYQAAPATLYGTTVSVGETRIDADTTTMALIKLDSGENIEAIVPGHLSFAKDRRVEIHRQSSLSGIPSYRIVNYTE